MWWYLILLLPVAVVLWLLYEWAEHQWVKYSTTDVECPSLPANQELRLCLMSDLHNNKKNLSKLTAHIQNFSPELILLAGDIVDKHNDKNAQAEKFIRALSETQIPIYYSVGNHEAYLMERSPRVWENYFHAIEKHVAFLDNRSVCPDSNPGIAVSGLSLPDLYYKKGSLQKSEEALPDFSVSQNRFHILMAHNPEYAKMYQRYHADFVVAGHLHGGLLRLPFIGGLVSPRLRFTKQDAGLVKLSDTSSLFISRGLGSHTIPLRFFNRVEVNFLILRGTAK